ncbi:MAG TPA: class I SAM-dependent methyltransferase [Terriglobales bacterium]|nr:class I SAM-dependent methyltransferase [Terriglobales bacterium]
MRLNAIEKMLLNNPARRLVQEFYETPLLLRMAGRLDGKRALEIGCGQGFGMEIILRRFGAAKVSGIDLDPKMMARAQERILPYTGRADVSLGNVTAIQAVDESFDAVFDFGVIHHVPAWEDAIREVRRVLKPGGVFVFEEVSKQALDRWIYRALFEHPKENRFTAENFVTALESHGIAVGDRLVSFFLGDFFAGVGRAI